MSDTAEALRALARVVDAWRAGQMPSRKNLDRISEQITEAAAAVTDLDARLGETERLISIRPVPTVAETTDPVEAGMVRTFNGRHFLEMLDALTTILIGVGTICDSVRIALHADNLNRADRLTFAQKLSDMADAATAGRQGVREMRRLIDPDSED